MPPIRSLASKCITCCSKLVTVIFSLSKIMPFYSCYIEKGLVCITITVPFSYQLFSYFKCTKLNIYLFYNI